MATATLPAPGVDDEFLEYTDDNVLLIMTETDAITNWNVLSILLGISNADKTRIMSDFHGQTHAQQQEFISIWLKNEKASWATLVTALKHQLVNKGAVANIIAKKYPKLPAGASPRRSNQQGTTPKTLPKSNQKVAANRGHQQSNSSEKKLNQDLVAINKKKIENRWQEPEFSKAQGIIYIVGVYGADGTAQDVENVESTFKKLNFAVFVVRDPTADEVACLMEAAGDLNYPFKYEYVAFYFAGHGGIDKDEKPFIVGLQKDESKPTQVMCIDDYIINPLKPLQEKGKSRLFFFDCCQSKSKGIEFYTGGRGLKPKPHPGQVVAYATNAGLKSWGDQKHGGIWTHHLCKNLLEYSESVTEILTRTNDDVTKLKGDFQQPYILSSLGRRILKQHNSDGRSGSTTTTDELPDSKLDSKLLYNKSPTLEDILEVVKEDCDSETLRKSLGMPREGDLKTAFSGWIREQKTDVTWKKLLKTLQETSNTGVVHFIVEEYLKKPSVHKRYISKPDYKRMIYDFD